MENVTVDGKYECVQKLWECVVYGCECVCIECALLSMTVPYLGDPRLLLANLRSWRTIASMQIYVDFPDPVAEIGSDVFSVKSRGCAMPVIVILVVLIVLISF